jgi:hypothetical protein
MHKKSVNLMNRRLTIIALEPGETFTHKLDPTSDQPCIVHARNPATAGALTLQGTLVFNEDAPAAGAVGFEDYTPGLFPLDASPVAPAGYAVVSMPVSPRALKFTLSAGADATAFIEVFE